MNDPSVLALGTPVLQSNINSPLAQAAGITSPYPGFNGNVAQALRKYPAVPATSYWRGVPTGESQYHALEAGARAALLEGAAGPLRLHLLAAEEQRRGERAGRQRRSTVGVQNPADPLEWG